MEQEVGEGLSRHFGSIQKKLLLFQMPARHVVEVVWLGSQALAICWLMFSALAALLRGHVLSMGQKHTQGSHTRVPSGRCSLSSYLATKNKILRKVDTSCTVP